MTYPFRQLTLVLMLMLAGVVLAADAAPRNVADQFTERYQAWRGWCAEHPLSSNLTGNQPFSALTGLGPQVVPLLLAQAEREAENGYGVSLVGAVRTIARIRLRGEREAKGNAERVALYLCWWMERKYYHYDRFATDDPNAPGEPWEPLCATLRDQGLDALPSLIAEFTRGEYRNLAVFAEITGGYGVPEQGTAQERAAAALAWWKAHQADWTLPPSDAVSLSVELLLDAPNTTLAFTVTNNRAWPRPTTPVATNRNRIQIIDPAGKLHGLTVYKDWMYPPVTIPPLGTQTWRWAVSPHFAFNKFTQPGIYRLIWNYEGTTAPDILLALNMKAGDPLPLPKRQGHINVAIAIPVTDAAPDQLIFTAVNDTDKAENLFDAVGGIGGKVTGPDGAPRKVALPLLEIQRTMPPGGAWQKWMSIQQLLDKNPDPAIPGRYTINWRFFTGREFALSSAVSLHLRND